MTTLDEKIEQTLQKNSEWSGSADALWGTISNQLQQPRTTKHPWKHRPLWFGAAAAATVFLAFMLHSMFTPSTLPPALPEPQEMARMQTFSVAMLPEPEVYRQGEQVELAFDTYLASEWEQDQMLRLVIWTEVEGEQIPTGELPIRKEDILGQHSLSIESPDEPGLYRLMLEGLFVHEGQRMAVFAEKTILVEGEISNENVENH